MTTKYHDRKVLTSDVVDIDIDENDDFDYNV